MKALITWGGWEGHQPDQVAALFHEMLTAEGVEAEVTDSLEAFDDAERLQALDLIVPVWTMSELTKERAQNVSEAVARGTGLAGCHGGMCDAFRENTLWQAMTGGNWVMHPGGDGVRHRVEIAGSHGLTQGIEDFEVETEQYYLHVDPANEVLATTSFPVVPWYHAANGPVTMPVAWIRRWGLGRVYYNALGHHRDVIDNDPPREMLRRGLLWAAEGKAAAAGQDLSAFVSDREGNNY
ncbi:ThuA domain-containing protein [Pseudoroseicyclus aestuarii]|uniref:ThuA-like domain-containing protein n=1 Tax=Pseudoroseicyclus aestuarii TaxID=1795041 RepID=A0A318SXJ4_9RHOB|nr:ThuA domain-containing protein [Pseudoroseicyclus aestuarii]PYE85086.1 hypothetical protein DFP88_102892 [Pseudoroseicyclus aestuarii]